MADDRTAVRARPPHRRGRLADDPPLRLTDVRARALAWGFLVASLLAVTVVVMSLA